MAPLFSIITVTYNAESTLPPTLKSVKEQTCSDYEYLIMDGASKDSTVQLSRESGIANIRITSEPDAGLYDAMNKAMDIATGKYLIFLNAGDAFHTLDTLQTIADTIKDNNYPGIVYGQTQLVNADRRRIADRHLSAPEHLTYRSFADGMLVCHQAFIALARIAPSYNLQYRFSADYDWCIQCLQHSRKNVYIPATIIDYLNEGVTTSNHKASLIERFNIMRYYYGNFTAVMKHMKFIPRFIARKRHMKKCSVKE